MVASTDSGSASVGMLSSTNVGGWATTGSLCYARASVQDLPGGRAFGSQ